MSQSEINPDSDAEQHNPWKAITMALGISATGMAIGWGVVKIHEIATGQNEHAMTEFLGALGSGLVTTMGGALIALGCSTRNN